MTLQSVVSVTVAILAVMVSRSPTARAQDANAQKEVCAADSSLKAKKMPKAEYTLEAMKKKIEGTVALCVMVDENGKVTNVRVLSGPAELVEPSVGAAKQWEFEPPPKTPVMALVEMTYGLTGPCPEGEGSDVGDVTVQIGSNLDDEQSDAMKILGNILQQRPPYPELARAQMVQGQLHLDIVVNPDGKVSDVRIVRPLDELLDRLALATVRTWVFKVSSASKPAIFPVTLTYHIPCLDKVHAP
jgi:TonB family protein